MTCKDFIAFLLEYLEGDLPKAQKARFEEHLSVCGSCVAYLSNYRDTVELAKAALGDPEGPVPEEVPEDLVAAVLSARKAGPAK
jgi:anti-sigma factor RsiW